jgi:branched-chain amino acid aminotransferase
VLELARGAGIPAHERAFSLTDVYGADEAFVTGTVAGLVPVREVDGRAIGDSRGADRPVTDRLRALYREAVERDVAGSARS